MRIIGGEHRGRRLATPRGSDIRPTSDRVREAVFNVLGPLAGASVLDVFAGTGAIGCEALSRGAGRVVFVEQGGQAARLVERNTATIGAGPREARLLHLRADRALRQLAAGGERFDIIYLDPPWNEAISELRSLVRLLPTLLAPGGTLLVETRQRDATTVEELLAGAWRGAVPRRRRYGDTAVVQLRPDTPTAEPEQQP